MEHQKKSTAVSRRAVLQLAAATGLAQLAPPFIISARGAQSVTLGLDNPLTGTYAATGKNELNGCELAVDQINAKRSEEHTSELQSLMSSSYAVLYLKTINTTHTIRIHNPS